jgi:hypothetical protein
MTISEVRMCDYNFDDDDKGEVLMFKIKLLFAIVGIALITYGMFKAYDCGHSSGWEARDTIAVKQFAEIAAKNQKALGEEIARVSKIDVEHQAENVRIVTKYEQIVKEVKHEIPDNVACLSPDGVRIWNATNNLFTTPASGVSGGIESAVPPAPTN